MLRRIACIVLAVFAGVSCSRDPEVVKKKYLQNGNRYYEKAKYKEAYIMYRNALKKDPKYSDAYYKVGLTELQLGKHTDALRDFRRAIDTDPNFTNADARVQAGNILLMAYVMSKERPAGVRDELRAITDQLLKKDANSVAGLRLNGYLKLIADRDAKAAVEQFRRAYQISPNDPQVVLPLVESLFDDNQPAEAEKLAKELINKRKDFLPVYDVLYRYYAREKRVNDADELLKAKVANNPKDSNAVLWLAQHYYRTGRTAETRAMLEKLSSNPNDYPNGQFLAGRFYAIIRDFDTAIRQFQDGMRRRPEKKADYQKEIAQVLIAQNKKNDAARALDEVLKANPKDDQAQAMRASLLIETGDPKQVQQAVTELQTAVGQDPKNAVLRFNLGRALIVRGQLDEARVQLQEALRLHKAYNPARLALAQIYMAQRQFANARQEVETALTYDKGNLTAKLIRTSALSAMGISAEARSELVEMIKQYPNSLEAALQLAVIDLSERRYKEAEDAFARLHKANPADLRALMGLSETYVAQNQYGKAEDVLKAELARNPSRLEVRVALGNTAYRSGDFAMAIEQYQAFVQGRPDSADGHLRLGQTFAMKGDLPAAIRAFEKAKQLKPNDPQPYLQLALLLERTGKASEARPVYEQILKLQPDNAVALNNLAYMIAESGGDLDQALAFAQKARQRWPNNPDVADTLGWIYIKKNLSDNAVTIFRDLVVKQPQVSTYRYHLAMALYQRGDKPEARKELQSALERKPSPQEAAKIKELMGRIG